jgi:predicted metal-dependent hydrolase
MPSRYFDVSGLGKVKVVRSKRSRHLRLSIKPDNTIYVSTPYWTPYRVALDFVDSKKAWIEKNINTATLLSNGDKIGKAHRLVIETTNVKRPYSRVIGNQIYMKIPLSADYKSEDIQKLAQKKCIEALTIEAKSLLPQRLRDYSSRYGFVFNSIEVKTLKSRWGSCSSKKDIILSCFLMQLSWKEIDYVIVHELAHTKVMAHNQKFWDTVRSVMIDADEIKKLLSSKKPHVMPQ